MRAVSGIGSGCCALKCGSPVNCAVLRPCDPLLAPSKLQSPPPAPCAESFTEVEQRAMMDSLRSATRNTGFERWLDAAIPPSRGKRRPRPRRRDRPAAGNPCGNPTSIGGGSGGAAATPCANGKQEGRSGGAGASGGLADVAAYLAGGSAPDGGTAAGGAAGVFRPGWEDIFRMNQKQLEVRGEPPVALK